MQAEKQMRRLARAFVDVVKSKAFESGQAIDVAGFESEIGQIREPIIWRTQHAAALRYHVVHSSVFPDTALPLALNGCAFAPVIGPDARGADAQLDP